ncbi:MAG TPA: DUF1918 domain-containing protein [Candidatus Dormibacteraeota bacterium]|nr:DUF1918 domain-containing protein [Candidatus Dormibacteraeota bacterium]
MDVARVGDRVILESEQVGKPGREGQILEILGAGNSVHYRVRWDDGHESTFFPSAGSVRILHTAKKR